MNLYSSKINYVANIILAVFAFYINYFFSNIGLYPIDTFSFFDSSYLITQGYHPIKDFWIISGIFVDYLQALFFLIFGSNWNAYIYHSSILNVFVSVFLFFFLNKLNTNFYVNFILSICFATLCYPVSGTPFPYQHSYILSLVSIMIFYLAVHNGDKKYWIALPIFMLFSFLSMQLPAGLINLLILIFILVFYFTVKKFPLTPFILGSVISILIIFFYFLLIKTDIKDFIIQIILFPLTIGEGRILGEERAYDSANLFKKLTIRGTFGHFKFIVIYILANLIATIYYIKKYKKRLSKKKVYLNLFLLFCTLSFIFHQLITANQTFIFSLIPMLSGLFIYQLKDFFNFTGKKIIIFLVIVNIFVTLKYYNEYNTKRKFMDLQNTNLKTAVEAKNLDIRFNNLRWITPFYFKDNPKKELALLKEAIFKISNENAEEVAVITHYQFFSLLAEKKIYILNRWYFPNNNTHPTSKDNKYYQYYKDKINKFIVEKKIKKIYLVKTYPKEFWFMNFEEILNDTCFSEKKYNEILYLINLGKC
tara:strand:+ start:737 stop:2341 length:1605 start_codon:yes stop_codon:yes gene_type:complete